MNLKSPLIIGLMSGTSLDGVDLAACQFTEEPNGWSYKVVAAKTITYSLAWESRLKNVMQLSGLELSLLDRELGTLLGQEVRDFCQKHSLQPDWIASHGHTIFHQPNKGLTLQIGHGYTIMAAANIPVINDFRSLDVALGGQGAPLVPIGDELLYSQYRYCLNLGGIANISLPTNNQRIAFDICPANGVLNWLAQKEGLSYDKGGALAAQGVVIPELVSQLNQLPFYTQEAPKSLGFEWVQQEILPIIKQYAHQSTANLCLSFCQHMAEQITVSVAKFEIVPSSKILVTGGGAYHTTFINLLTKSLAQHQVEVVVPDSQTIEFKEAIVFAFLGHLRLAHRTNVLSSVTGASRNSVGGAIYSEV